MIFQKKGRKGKEKGEMRMYFRMYNLSRYIFFYRNEITRGKKNRSFEDARTLTSLRRIGEN